jgi:hypothetical protein
MPASHRLVHLREAIMQDDDAYFERALGAAVVRRWGQLPRNIQEALFEEAVGANDKRQPNGDGLREHLAVYLHGKHPRTDHHTAS